MPKKQSTAEVIRRWMFLDARLAAGVLRVPEAAATLGVDERTIHRDLDGMERLGYPPECRGPAYGFRWRYPEDQQPMFTASERWAKR